MSTETAVSSHLVSLSLSWVFLLYLCFFFNVTATTEIYTLSLHDALPIFFPSNSRFPRLCAKCLLKLKRLVSIWRIIRSEERFSRNAETDLVCRLLLEKKKSNSRKLCR